MHSNDTIKNVSWPHFSWPTPYIISYMLCNLIKKLHAIRVTSQNAEQV